MRKSISSFSAIVMLCATTLILGAFADAAIEAVNSSDSWRIECSGDAKSSGTIQFRVLPQQGEVVTVSVQVANGRSENEVAKDIRDAFRAQLPPARFQAETDDGEDVLIKKKSGQPDFAIELGGSSVEHVRLNVQRE